MLCNRFQQRVYQLPGNGKNWCIQSGKGWLGMLCILNTIEPDNGNVGANGVSAFVRRVLYTDGNLIVYVKTASGGTELENKSRAASYPAVLDMVDPILRFSKCCKRNARLKERGNSPITFPNSIENEAIHFSAADPSMIKISLSVIRRGIRDQ